MWWLLLIEGAICTLVALLVYRKYGSFRKQGNARDRCCLMATLSVMMRYLWAHHTDWYTTLLVIFGWALCFMVVFLLPTDVSMVRVVSIITIVNTLPFFLDQFGSIDWLPFVELQLPAQELRR